MTDAADTINDDEGDATNYNGTDETIIADAIPDILSGTDFIPTDVLCGAGAAYTTVLC